MQKSAQHAPLAGPPPGIAWEDRLTRLSLALLVFANVYGIVAGAYVTMYYEVVPDMGTIEDSLASPLLILYGLALIAGLIHLPIALADLRQKLWQQAAIRLAAFAGPLVIFLGVDGLLAHWLWWSPLSETDRYHLLHHYLFAGAPLTLGFWLLMRRWWRPATFIAAAPLARRDWLITGAVISLVVAGVAILSGLSLPTIGAALALIWLLLAPLAWRAQG